MLEKMKLLSNEIRKLKKKKKGKGKKKKIKKRIKHLEMECEQLKRIMLFNQYQEKMQSKQQVWWQEALTTSLPGFFELATAAVNRFPDKRSSTIYLPEKK
ncbi:MAG: hypothetical protein IJN54_16145 [Lachnospiraceae bacterium]|nr:hypothetical protein [Lachnospiraceae bacterium]